MPKYDTLLADIGHMEKDEPLVQTLDLTYAVAMTLLSTGILLALVHIVAWVLVVRRDGEDAEPGLLPWGYIGVGLLVAFLGFYLTRGVAAGSWGSIADLRVVVMTLGVASWGFGAAHDWATIRFGRSVRWTMPLLLSALTGVALGAASPVLAG